MGKSATVGRVYWITQRDRRVDEGVMGALGGLHQVGAKSRRGVTGVVQHGRVVLGRLQ